MKLIIDNSGLPKQSDICAPDVSSRKSTDFAHGPLKVAGSPFFGARERKELDIVASLGGKLTVSAEYIFKMTGISFASSPHSR